MESSPVTLDQFRNSLLAVLEETFESVQGIYLDKRTSLFETLDGISAEAASKSPSDSRSTIAAHVYHLCFYLDVVLRSIRAEPVGTVDWKESWKVQRVTKEEWEALKARCRTSYHDVLAVVKGMDAWDRPDDVTDSLAILAHTAYHLGAIRMALGAAQDQA